MAKYKLLIIDDEWDRRKKSYETVLENDGVFDLIFLPDKARLSHLSDYHADAYLIDIFLSENGWITKASEVIERYVKTNPKPIFLITEHWKNEEIREEINRIFKYGVPIKHFFAWDEFADATGCVVDNDSAAATRWKIEMELDSWYERARFSPPSNDTVRILHISDLQFKDPGTSVRSFLVDSAIADSLKNAKRPPDLLVVTGDITYSGRPEEYQAALKWFEGQLLPALWGDDIDSWRERIILVPGNHDVNLRFCACDTFDYNFEIPKDKKKYSIIKSKTIPSGDHKIYGLEPFRKFAAKLSPDRHWQSNANLCWICDRFLPSGIQFILVNSAASVDSSDPSATDIPEEILIKVVAESRNSRPAIPPYRILISHHGPQSRDPKIKSISDWPRFENFIETCKIDLFIHGHGHGFDTNSMGGTSSRSKIPVVMAPSTHLGGKLRDEDQLRGFNLIEISREDYRVESCQVLHYEIRGSSAEVRRTTEVYNRIK